MSELPELRAHGYAVEAVLGGNPEGGRTAYRGVELATGRAVVVKRYAFARGDSTWDGHAAHEREIAMLEQLEHPRIPAYLADFATDDGFCLVQAYCPAPPMTARATWTIDEITRFARSALRILVYLQDRAPPIVHRDIKPENLLVGDDGEAYLVDFGLARADRAAATTLAVGTPGFIAPEQLYGQAVTEATDLYGLGASLLCALTGTRPVDVGALLDGSFRFDLTRLPRAVPPALRRWLGRMVAPSLDERFASARDALAALDAPAAAEPAPASPPGAAPWTPRSLTAAAVAIGAVAAIGGLVALVGRGDAPPSRPPPPTASRPPHGSPPAPLAGTPPPARGGAPIDCRGPMTVTRALSVSGARWAVVAHDGCELTLRGVSIEGRYGIQVKGGRVVAEDVTVVDAERGIDVLRGELVVSGGSITCAEHCVSVRAGGALRVTSASISSAGDGVAVHGGDLALTDTSVRAADVAVIVAQGTARLTRAHLAGRRALGAGASTVTIDGGQLDGDISFQTATALVGLATAAIAVGDETPRFWARAACTALVACARLAGEGEPVHVSLEVAVRADGGLDAPTPSPQRPQPAAVAACMAKQASAFRMPGHDGAARRFRCLADGTVRDGVASVSTIFTPLP